MVGLVALILPTNAVLSKLSPHPNETVDGTMSAPKIFLCHASEDKDTVASVHAQLHAFGFQPWLDKIDLLPGDDWQCEIPKVIKASDFVMVFLSTTSVSKRGYVQKEFKLALDVLDECPEGTIYLIPVKLDDCNVPQKFAHLHYVSLREPGALEKIAKAIRRHSSKVKDSTTPSLSAADFASIVSRGMFPAYDLDENFLFKRWNRIFEAIIARPMGLTHGQHVMELVHRCDNYKEIIYHSRAVFQPDAFPTHDRETIVMSTPNFGRIVFNKTAFQAGSKEWHVELFPVDGERIAELFHAMKRVAESSEVA